MLDFGLFDNLQVDPLDEGDPGNAGAVFETRLADLSVAEELGYQIAFTGERHYMAGYRSSAPTAWVAAATQRTKRIRLGVLAYTLPLHAPARLAEEVAVLDQLSGGRIEVGLGLGHRPEELTAVGIDPTVRIPIFQERAALLRALWSGANVSFESDHTILRDVAINPLPVQLPHPPLWYAGTDPTAAEWAGSQGMSLALGFAPTVGLVPAARAHAAATAERSLDQPRPRLALLRHAYVADSDRAAHDEMIDDLMRLEALRTSAGAGSRTERRATARTRAAELVRDELVIAGGPETVAKMLRAARRQLGIDCFLVNPYLAGLSSERVRRTLTLLMTEVGPRLADSAES